MSWADKAFRVRPRAAQLAGVLLAAWLCSCATASRVPATPAWRCAACADAAVANGDWEQAAAAHRELLAREPANCLAVYHLGYIAGRLGDRAQEAVLYEKAVHCGYRDDDQLFFNLGMAYGDMHRLAQALAAFERGVALAPDHADNHFGLGLMAEAAGQPARAIAALERAVALAPEHAEARLALVRVYLDQENFSAARQHLDALLQADAQNEEALDLQQTLRTRQGMHYER